MKKYISLYILFIFFAVFVMPVCLTVFTSQKNIEIADSSSVTSAPIKIKKGNDVFLVKTEQGIQSVDRLIYTVRCVGSEISPDYPKEAIKANAVAVYTFALHRAQQNKGEKYDITDNPQSDQSCKPLDEIKSIWADNYKTLYSAVKSVFGQYLIDENSSVALTLYHAVSPGRTDNAKDIFGSHYPYLQRVDCSFDILSADYLTVKQYTHSEFKNIFKSKTKFSDTPKEWFTEYNVTQSGAVMSVKIGSKSFTGKQVRELLSLPSYAFDAVIDDEYVTIRTKGKGHGVGMSQFGSRALAEQGEDYKSILGYFYYGCKLRTPQK